MFESPDKVGIILKRATLIAISTLLVSYLFLYAFASFQYEKKINFFYKQSEAIFSQLEAKVPQRTEAFVRDLQVSPGLKKPSLLQPTGLVSIVFEADKVHEAILGDLQALLTVFKDELGGLDLSGLHFAGQHKDLSHANLRNTVLKKTILEGANFTQVDLSEAKLQDAHLRGIRLSGAKLNKADLSNVDLRAAELSDADLRETNLFYADFIGANMSRSNLRGLKMSGADFREVNFSQADLSRAILSGARLDGANLSDANLEGADLRYADLSKTSGLKQEQLANVIVDHNTTLPDRLQGGVVLQ